MRHFYGPLARPTVTQALGDILASHERCIPNSTAPGETMAFTIQRVRDLYNQAAQVGLEVAAAADSAFAAEIGADMAEAA